MRWISRFSFTFLIVGMLLGYYAYQAVVGKIFLPAWQVILCMVGASFSFVLGFIALRERHRNDGNGVP